LKFEISRYRLLKHVTACGEEVFAIFWCAFLWNLEDEKLLTAKTVASGEAIFHLLGVSSDVT
jgi:hypothetical protein